VTRRWVPYRLPESTPHRIDSMLHHVEIIVYQWDDRQLHSVQPIIS
jgi:hypothetical protein